VKHMVLDILLRVDRNGIGDLLRVFGVHTRGTRLITVPGLRLGDSRFATRLPP
jgi:hypothetical protein